MSSEHSREVRLKSMHAHLYPGILAGVWLAAPVVTELLVTRAHEEGVTGSARALFDPKHFEFRGGRTRAPALGHLRTRATDRLRSR